jgi:long-chain acyl-CoA synthetase
MNFLNKILSIFKENNNEKEPWHDLYGNNIPPKLEYPTGSMYDAFYKAYKKYPDYRAYTYFKKHYSYRDLNSQIVDIAKSLKAIGVKRGDRVTICMPNTPDAIIMFYAINMIGAISNMIHPLSSEKEIIFYLEKSNSEYILCLDLLYPKIEKVMENIKLRKVIISKITNKMPKYLSTIYNLTNKSTKVNYSKKVISWETFYKLGKSFDGEFRYKGRDNDDAVILYSGGTTGDAKGVVLSNLCFNALATQCFKMTDPAKAGDSVLTIMPIFHGFGIGVCVHTELISGMSIILVPRFSPKEFSKLIKQNKPAFLAGVPTMYEALINSKEKSKTYLKSVCNVICGGDVLNETLRDKVDEYLKLHGSSANIRVGYGLTECTGASCLTPRYYFKEGGIGIPLPDMSYKIVKIGTFEKADNDEDGEICISGPTVMKRYLDDPEETKKVLKRHSDGKIWLHTGDVGCMNKEGLVFFKSRLKRIIISSGYNIYPQYVEKVIMSHPSVSTCTVVGIPHPYKKQVPKAYIILRENFDDTEELRNDIKEYCKKSIVKYSIPAEYEYVKELPKTLVGKVAFTKLGGCNGKK